MWPRLIAQLLELLPHVSRLVPVADKYFSTKSASERAQEAAIAALAADLRTGVGGLTEAQAGAVAGLDRQMKAQAAELIEVRAALKESQASLVAQENRLVAIERGVRALKFWGAVVALLIVGLLGTMVWIGLHEAR